MNFIIRKNIEEGQTMILRFSRVVLMLGACTVGAFARDFYLMGETLLFGGCVAVLGVFLLMAWGAE